MEQREVQPDADKSQQQLEKDSVSAQAYCCLLKNNSGQGIIGVTADRKFLYLNSELQQTHLRIGQNDEIVDAVYLPRPPAPQSSPDSDEDEEGGASAAKKQKRKNQPDEEMDEEAAAAAAAAKAAEFDFVAVAVNSQQVRHPLILLL
jgi:hypothetical protein